MAIVDPDPRFWVFNDHYGMQPVTDPITPPCDVSFDANMEFEKKASEFVHRLAFAVPVPYKYDEAGLVQEVMNFITSTYGQHYVGEDGVQSLDLIFSVGHGEGFCIGNALKYLARYGRKNGRNREDLLKAVHYIVLAMYLADEESRKQEK